MFSNYLQFCGAIDDHNRKIIDGDGGHGMSLETTWRTIRWENRVFGFILGVIEVNTYLVMRYFGPLRKIFGSFHKNLAFELVFDELYMTYENQGSYRARKWCRKTGTTLLVLHHMGNLKMVDGKKKYKTKYRQHPCRTRNCPTRCMTLCKCSNENFIGRSCFAKHCIE